MKRSRSNSITGKRFGRSRVDENPMMREPAEKGIFLFVDRLHLSGAGRDLFRQLREIWQVCGLSPGYTRPGKNHQAAITQRSQHRVRKITRSNLHWLIPLEF